MVVCCIVLCVFFFFKQKTAYEMRISDWSSDVCSSDLPCGGTPCHVQAGRGRSGIDRHPGFPGGGASLHRQRRRAHHRKPPGGWGGLADQGRQRPHGGRSEEHTSELQSLMRISYAVFCLKKKNDIITTFYPIQSKPTSNDHKTEH